MKKLVLAGVFAVLPLACGAREDRTEFGLGVNRDNADGHGASADLALTLADRHKLSLSHQGNQASYRYWSPCTRQYGWALLFDNQPRPYQRAREVFPEQEIENRSRYNTWSYSYLGDVWGGGVRGSRYDGGDGLRSSEFGLHGYWQDEHWDINVEANRSDDDFALMTQRYNGNLLNPQCLTTEYGESFERRGAGLTLGYTSDGGYRFFVSSMGYRSDFAFPATISYETLLLRSVNAGTLSTVLTKNRLTIGAQLPIADWIVSVEAGREQSLVDESITRFATIWLIVPITVQWELEFTATSTRIDLGNEAESSDTDDLRSLGAGMRWYW